MEFSAIGHRARRCATAPKPSPEGLNLRWNPEIPAVRKQLNRGAVELSLPVRTRVGMPVCARLDRKSRARSRARMLVSEGLHFVVLPCFGVPARWLVCWFAPAERVWFRWNTLASLRSGAEAGAILDKGGLIHQFVFPQPW